MDWPMREKAIWSYPGAAAMPLVVQSEAKTADPPTEAGDATRRTGRNLHA